MQEGYRHIHCGQVTMPEESNRKGDDLFCVKCGTFHPFTDFLTATTHKEVKLDMAADTVLYLNCPQNNMKLTLQELLKQVEAGNVTSLYITGTSVVDGEDRVLNACILSPEAPLYSLLGGMTTAVARITSEIEHNVQVIE